MEDKQPNQPTDIEMKPVNLQQEEKEEKLPYKKGDMYVWFLIQITPSRYDPIARARAANMTSYVSVIVNIALAVGKVGVWSIRLICSGLPVISVTPLYLLQVCSTTPVYVTFRCLPFPQWFSFWLCLYYSLLHFYQTCW